MINNAGDPLGTLNIFQENALKPLIVVGAGGLFAAALQNQNNVRVEVVSNAAGTAGAARCSAATLGNVFNPAGVRPVSQLENS